MALSARQRRRVAWLIDGHLADDYDETAHESRWEKHFAAISSPEELYLYASSSHSNQSPKEWRRILDNPLCDAGTALLIFWRNSPIYYYGPEPAGGWDRDRLELVQEIEKRYRSGSYLSAVVRFDPATFKGSSFLAKHSADELSRVPEELRRHSPGEPVPVLTKHDFKWEEGF